MPKINNLVGQRFGRLTVLEKTDKVFHRYIVWHCKCDCGNEIDVPSSYLQSGKVISCGCLRSEKYKGMRFGKLTVVGQTNEKDYNGYFLWECKCDCGNIIKTRMSSLRNGNTKSCGCIRSENLVGQRFGRLTVLEKTDKRKNRYIIWKCKCDCGNITYVDTGNLKKGKTRSCGCIKREILRERAKNRKKEK